jgi:hypothetical protein
LRRQEERGVAKGTWKRSAEIRPGIGLLVKEMLEKQSCINKKKNIY